MFLPCRVGSAGDVAARNKHRITHALDLLQRKPPNALLRVTSPGVKRYGSPCNYKLILKSQQVYYMVLSIRSTIRRLNFVVSGISDPSASKA
jgi:hypothetical protein